MKNTLIVLAIGAASFAMPAQAQILGSGGLGGTVGGVLGGGSGGTGQSIGGAVAGRGGGAVRLDRQIDRRRGRADARGSGSAGGDVLLGGASTGLLGGSNGGATGSAAGTGEAGIGLQAIGTDQIRNTARGAAGRARNVIGSTSGSISGSGSASGAGSGSGDGLLLNGLAGSATGALSGAGRVAAPRGADRSETGAGNDQVPQGGGFDSMISGASEAAGSVSLEPGMAVRDRGGRLIGRVEDFRAGASGLIEAVLVRVGDRIASFPASNFTVSGDALVSAMSRGEVRREAAEQQAAE